MAMVSSYFYMDCIDYLYTLSSMIELCFLKVQKGLNF